jgi:hypothetical protein
VKDPFHNDKIKRSVASEEKTDDGHSLPGSAKTNNIASFQKTGGLRIPRGVYRFKTHEEANEWMEKISDPGKIPKT